MLLKWFACITFFMICILKWYFPSENFWIDLAHAYTCLWLEVYQALMIFLFQSSHITFMPNAMLLCRSAWLWPLLLSSWLLPRLLLASTYTKRTDCLCIQNPWNKLRHMSPPYLPIYGIYRPSYRRLSCTISKLFKCTSLFVSVQAHGALGAINIFHAKNVLLLDKV